MKGIVLHLTPCTGNTMIFSARIARFLAEEFDLPLMDRPDPALVQDYDLAILVNSPTGFAPAELRWQVAEICNRATYYVFTQNDYKLAPPSQCKRYALEHDLPVRTPIRWTTVPCRMSGCPEDTVLPLNAIAYRQPPLPPCPKPHGRTLLYYGALRRPRLPRLAHYMQTQRYATALSAPKRSWKAFAEEAVDPDNTQFLPQFKNLHEELAAHTATLYIEDPFSNSNYCSPATRWYEALSAGTLILVDKDVTASLYHYEKALLEPLVVEGPADVAYKLKHWRRFTLYQNETFRLNYPSGLRRMLREAMAKLDLG